MPPETTEKCERQLWMVETIAAAYMVTDPLDDQNGARAMRAAIHDCQSITADCVEAANSGKIEGERVFAYMATRILRWATRVINDGLRAE